MTVGCIGLGLIGQRRLQIAHDMGHAVAFGVDPESRRWRQASLPDCRFVARLEEVDIGTAKTVFIAVPHHLAFPCVSWALESGLHVMCEKPLGLNQDQAERLWQSARQRNLCLAIGFNYRFLVGVRRLRALLTEGRLGRLQRVRMLLGHGGRPGMEKEWKLQRAMAGGGVVMDPGIHLLDLVRHLVGEPTLTGARLRRCFWPADVEDNACLDFRCDEADVSLELSLTHWQNQFSLEFYGSEAMAVATGRGGNYGTQQLQLVNRWFWQHGNDHREHLELGTVDDSFVLETQAFLDWCNGAPVHPSLATGGDGVAAAALVDAIYAHAAHAAPA